MRCQGICDVSELGELHAIHAVCHLILSLSLLLLRGVTNNGMPLKCPNIYLLSASLFEMLFVTNLRNCCFVVIYLKINLTAASGEIELGLCACLRLIAAEVSICCDNSIYVCAHE